MRKREREGEREYKSPIAAAIPAAGLATNKMTEGSERVRRHLHQLMPRKSALIGRH